jgi:hypothetical protein
MDSNVSDIIDKLKYCKQDGKITSEGDSYLVVLNYLLPELFLKAIDLIESKSCHKYTCESRSLRVIKSFLVNSAMWGCSCNEFTKAMVNRHKPICEHLIAGYLLDELDWWEEPVKELGTEEFSLI